MHRTSRKYSRTLPGNSIDREGYEREEAIIIQLAITNYSPPRTTVNLQSQEDKRFTRQFQVAAPTRRSIPPAIGLVVILRCEDEGCEPEVRKNGVGDRVVEFVCPEEGCSEGGDPEAERNSGNNHLEDEVLIVRIVVQEVTRDADDDGGAGPDHEVAGADDGLLGVVEAADGHHVCRLLAGYLER